jgi:hypothetical protein
MLLDLFSERDKSSELNWNIMSYVEKLNVIISLSSSLYT